MEIIQAKNKGILCLILIALIYGFAQLQARGMNLSGEGEVSLFLIILWVLSIFIKWEVKTK